MIELKQQFLKDDYMSWEDDFNKGYHTGDWNDFNRGLYEQDDRNRSNDNGYSSSDPGSPGNGTGDSGGGDSGVDHRGADIVLMAEIITMDTAEADAAAVFPFPEDTVSGVALLLS